MKSKISILCALTMTCAVVFTGCKVRYENDNVPTLSEEKEIVTEMVSKDVSSDSIKIRYSGSAYTEYLNKCKTEFEKKYSGTEVILEQVEKENYLVNIGNNSSEGTDVPDLYIIGTDELSTAYLAGLASKVQSDTFVKDNYDDIAINACSYNGTMVAYPLSFKTTILAYNTAYVESDQSYTIEEIMQYSDEADFSKSGVMVKKIFGCNISDLFMNYGFLGFGIDIGGKNGCDKNVFSVYNDTTVKASKSYVELIQFFSLDSKLKYEDSVKELMEGQTVFSIVSTDTLSELEKSGQEFVYSEFPDYNGIDKTSPLSITTALVINPYGVKSGTAIAFAEFVAGEMASELYSYSGLMSTNKNVYSGDKFEGIYKSYLKSSSKNKLKYGEQAYPLIEIAMHNIASGEDAAEQLKSVDDYMKKQLG